MWSAARCNPVPPDPPPSSLSLLYSLANHTEINELQLEQSSQRPSVALDRSTSTSRADAAAAAAAALPVKLQNTFAATAQKPNSPEPGRARGASGVSKALPDWEEKRSRRSSGCRDADGAEVEAGAVCVPGDTIQFVVVA